jgi:hypothetical protein
VNIAAPDDITIEHAARAAGIGTGVLRMWEQRYGWPAPRRLANGFRAYTRHQVDDLCRVVQLVQAGYSISHLIVDGLPSWPGAKDTPTPRWQVLERITMPTPVARRFRDRAIHLAAGRRESALLHLVHLAPLLLRRNDRAVAGWLPIEAALQEWERVRLPLRRSAAIRDAMRCLAAPNWHAVPELAAVVLMAA